MPTKFRDLVILLKEDGWRLGHTTGSHRIYEHPAKGRVTVPFHGDNKEIAPGTLKAILKQAGLKNG